MQSAYVAARVVKGKSSNLLTIQSQDGWYGNSKQQVAAHNSSAIFRAVENRLPVVHAINSGPSIIISPKGEVLFITEHLVKNHWQFQLPIADKKHLTFYSIYASQIHYLFYAMFVATIALAAIRIKFKKNYSRPVIHLSNGCH
jgi:apolipoprotein N-acyltransferase